MKVYIANDSKQSIGGGWTFIRNFIEGLKRIKAKVELVDFDVKADVVLIPSSTMTDYDKMKVLKDRGAKIILRINGIPEDSRNRGTGYSRLMNMALLADRLVFQSVFSRIRFLEAFKDQTKLITKAEKKSDVINNGVDNLVFCKEGDTFNWDQSKIRFLFVQYNRHENKRFQEAKEIFRLFKGNKELVIVGRFCPEMIEYRFDLYPHEEYLYIPTMEDRKDLAKLMRSCDVLLFPAILDNMPNTVLEARACGLAVILHPYGGAVEGYTFQSLVLGSLPVDHLWSNREAITLNIKRIIENKKADNVFLIEDMSEAFYQLFKEVLS